MFKLRKAELTPEVYSTTPPHPKDTPFSSITQEISGGLGTQCQEPGVETKYLFPFFFSYFFHVCVCLYIIST